MIRLLILLLGTIRVEKRATLEPKTYNISVLGIDRGAPSRSSRVVVSVTVIDVNEKPPYFPASSFTTIVEENNPPNKPVVKYPAKDPDSNANLVYSIIKERMTALQGSTPLQASLYQVSHITLTNGT